jgi:hypothetical protein
MIPTRTLVALTALAALAGLTACVSRERSVPTEVAASVAAANQPPLRKSLIYPLAPTGPASPEEQRLMDQLLARAGAGEERDFLREALKPEQQQIVVLRVDGDTVMQNMVNRLLSLRQTRLREQLTRKRAAMLERMHR